MSIFFKHLDNRFFVAEEYNAKHIRIEIDPIQKTGTPQSN